jgi:multisubunit Na+/H+ antiporter MnhE subunit
MRGNRILAIALVILAVIFAVGAVIYFQKTTFLASGRPIRHVERAIVLIVLAVICLAAAAFARPRQTRI